MVKLLTVEAQTAARNALEAFCTHAKVSKLNRKEECFYITREPKRYIRVTSLLSLDQLTAPVFRLYGMIDPLTNGNMAALLPKA
ncbi:unnamed protein product [Heligmosomoides polygyrus]|uniref:Transcriptional regulator n=1 Tax=Heligmosomoides polygyrus TaxID=6339 RepID=A0A183FL80_HELPZ|nr:unnamed protein product [Heligmosomoides polygyrus]